MRAATTRSRILHRIAPLSAGILAVALIATSCHMLHDPMDHDDRDHHDDHDAVTTVHLELVAQGTTDTTRVTWEDLDGVGGNNPNRIDTLVLKSGTIYIGSVRFEDAKDSPVEDLTKEVLEEADEHQVFFSVSNGIGQVSVLDKDGKGLPIGLVYMLTTPQDRSESNGVLTVSLSHFDSPSSKNGRDPSAETDIEVAFPLVLK